MESRIKERLTGALILVAALVVLVPEIFSGKRGSESSQPEAAAPVADAPPLRTYTSEPDAAAPPLVQAPAEPASPAPPPVQEEREPEPAAPAITEVRPAPPAPSSTRPAPEAKPSSASASAPANAGKDMAPAAAGDWYVQVGSFSQAANAQRYAQQLRGEGFTAVVLPASGAKALVRVRVGPVRNREAAVQLLNKLTASGHKGAVVGP